VGGFKPPPAGRLRRAYLHLSRNTASRRSTYIKPPSAFVTHGTGTPRNRIVAELLDQSGDASSHPARARHPSTQQTPRRSIINMNLHNFLTPCRAEQDLPGVNDTSHVELKKFRSSLLTSSGRSR